MASVAATAPSAGSAPGRQLFSDSAEFAGGNAAGAAALLSGSPPSGGANGRVGSPGAAVPSATGSGIAAAAAAAGGVGPTMAGRPVPPVELESLRPALTCALTGDPLRDSPVMLATGNFANRSAAIAAKEQFTAIDPKSQLFSLLSNSRAILETYGRRFVKVKGMRRPAAESPPRGGAAVAPARNAAGDGDEDLTVEAADGAPLADDDATFADADAPRSAAAPLPSVSPKPSSAAAATPSPVPAKAPAKPVAKPGPASAAALASVTLRSTDLVQRAEALLTEVLAAHRGTADEESKFRVDIERRRGAALKHVRGAQPGSSKRLKVQADECYEASEYTKAIALYSDAIAVKDGTTRISGIYGNRSAANFMLGLYRAAIADCEASLAEDPHCTPENRGKMSQRAAKAACCLGDLPLAADLFARIPEPVRAKQNLDADLDRFQRASGAFQDAQVTKSKERWEMIITEFPDAPLPRQHLARIYLDEKHYSRVIHLLDRPALMPLPGGAGDVHAETALLLATASYKDGFESFDRALRVLPAVRSFDATGKLLRLIEVVNEGKQQGNDHFGRKEFARAVECYTRAIDADPLNDRVVKILYCNRAAARKELKLYREGIDDCTRAIALDSEFPKAYSRRARCRRELKDFVGAVDDFQKAISIEQRLSPKERKDAELKRELDQTLALQREEREREKDFYHVLGVSERASADDINAAYKKLSLQLHPDKNRMKPEAERAECERKFKVATEARDTLRDPTARAKYDRERAAAAAGPGRFASGAGAGFGGAGGWGNRGADYGHGMRRAQTGGYGGFRAGGGHHPGGGANGGFW